MTHGFRRLNAAEQHYEPLNISDLDRIYDARRTSFTPEFWVHHIADDSHYNLVARVKTPFDCRLLYDSWLWRLALESVAKWTEQPIVLELLPGSSLTIPVALESIGYTGELRQVNDELPAAIPEWFHFKHSWIAAKINDIVSKPLQPSMILGNHIIDDMLFDLYYNGIENKSRYYSNIELCKMIWASLAESRTLNSLQTSVADLFTQMAHGMTRPSMLILRHYPSTFALLSNDLARINTEMETFYTIAKALSRSAGCEVYFLDVSGVNAPAGSLYPRSFLIVKMRPSSSKRTTQVGPLPGAE